MKQLQDNNGDCVHIAIGYWLCFKQYIHRVRKKKIQQIFVHNFNKFKYIIVNFGKQNQAGNAKLPIQLLSTSLN